MRCLEIEHDIALLGNQIKNLTQKRGKLVNELECLKEQIISKIMNDNVIENENMKSLKEHCEEFHHNDVYETVYFECETNGILVANWDYCMDEEENTVLYIIVYNNYEIYTLRKKY